MRLTFRPRAWWLAFLLILCVAAAPAAAETTSTEAARGVGSALSSLVYGPVKVVYATLGLVFGGFAWGLSGGDSQVAEAVITPAVRGDWVVTPAHLAGEKPLEFIGRAPGYETAPATAVIEEPYASSADPYAPSEPPYVSAPAAEPYSGY